MAAIVLRVWISAVWWDVRYAPMASKFRAFAVLRLNKQVKLDRVLD
jgi:hypothetical protein